MFNIKSIQTVHSMLIAFINGFAQYLWGHIHWFFFVILIFNKNVLSVNLKYHAQWLSPLGSQCFLNAYYIISIRKHFLLIAQAQIYRNTVHS